MSSELIEGGTQIKTLEHIDRLEGGLFLIGPISNHIATVYQPPRTPYRLSPQFFYNKQVKYK